MNADERTEFIADIAAAIRALAAQTTLSDDEQRWVRMAIKREAQSSEFRKAIIEKTLGGSLSPFMAYLSDRTELNPVEVQELKALVRALERKDRA